MTVMKKTTFRFKPYCPDQLLLLPPDMKQWLPEDDLAYFIMDVVGELELSPIYHSYCRSRAGQPPYSPRMMVSLILYAYCVGLPSSRKIEAATYTQVPFRVLTADQHPDHDTIADFRKTHLQALAGLFVDVLCAGMSMGAWSRDTFSPNGAGIAQFLGAIRTDLFGNPREIAAHVESILQQVRDSAKAHGQSRIYIHGEKETEKRADSVMNGIALDDATWKMFEDYAAKFGLPALTT